MKSSSFCSPNVSRTTLSSRSTPSLNAMSHSFLLWGVACNLLSASVMLHVSLTSTVDIFITVIDLKKLLDCVAREEMKIAIHF